MTKRLIALFLTLTLGGGADARPHHPVPKPAAPDAAAKPATPSAHSKYAVLMDAVSGKVLWARNADVRRPMASTTKIMTATLLLERGHLQDIVTAPPGIDQIPESSLHLSPGEKLTLNDLLYAMLLRSANDTAVAGADYLAGSVPAFVALMNQKAQEEGATNTHFVTPNGLYAKDHYSTAHDLATMARYAVLNLPDFDRIVRTQKYKITRTVHFHDSMVVNTASKFLKTFPGADGVKTGYVHQAGHCFVGSATRVDGQGRPWRLIAVALNSNSCREDVESILNYGFANFAPTVAVPKDAPAGTVTVPGAARAVPVKAADDLKVVIAKSAPVPVWATTVTTLTPLPPAPVAAGTKLGTIVVTAGGKVQATGDAVAAETVPLQPAVAALRTTKHLGAGLLRGLSTALGVLMLLCLGLMIYVEKIHGHSRKSAAHKLAAGRASAKSARERGDQLPTNL